MHNEKIKNVLKILFGSMSVFMVYLVIVTSMKSNMFALPSEVVNEPWFQTTLVDFYFNIVILSAWVIYKENHIGKSIAWIVGFIVLGSIATCFYVLLQLMRLKSDQSFNNILLRNK